MRRRYKAELIVLSVAFAATTLVAQKPSLFSSAAAEKAKKVLERARMLYGTDAPKEVTWVVDDSGPVGWINGVGNKTQTKMPSVVRTGVIVLEEGGELQLDTSPCQLRVMTFVGPVRKTKLEKQVTCGDNALDLYEIRKQ